MRLNLVIKENKVYLVRWFFFKMYIGKYIDGDIIITNKNLVDKLKKGNHEKFVMRSGF